MVIPPSQLSSEILQSIAEEFITREGTDYGEHEMTLQDKLACLLPRIIKGEVLIVFDAGSETLGLVNREDYQAVQPLV